ncbi:MAG: RNA 2'-phosphotransferase [Methanobacteriota archaeon]|nr:MAG: RNA 2'-phosphotransferase [Euryarchaeota archaeon]
MNSEELDRLSRTLAGVLRHFPERFDLEVDRYGFVDLREFVNAIQSKQRRYHWLRPHHVLAIIETDNKGRYEFRDGKIRATYAHSFDVELDSSNVGIPDSLYYPATEEEVDIIVETGIKPSDRKRVHLSKTVGDAVNAGRVRTESPVILEVDVKSASEDGVVIQKAGKTVYLAEEIGPKYLKKMDVDLSKYPSDSSKEETEESSQTEDSEMVTSEEDKSGSE